ncbi:MAG: hypothetical protein BWX92_01851 [Deltaproteobacteria bacterium ADurb.Bin135]|nr:MAG: hypothetical protein BWX92_01851 [Deltaproteobacteria bacterium ADurb.Bin135]
MRDNSERILDMLEAIGHIERYSGKGRETFQEDELNEPPCCKQQGIRGKNLCYKKNLALPGSKLQGIIKLNAEISTPPIPHDI